LDHILLYYTPKHLSCYLTLYCLLDAWLLDVVLGLVSPGTRLGGNYNSGSNPKPFWHHACNLGGVVSDAYPRLPRSLGTRHRDPPWLSVGVRPYLTLDGMMLWGVGKIGFWGPGVGICDVGPRGGTTSIETYKDYYAGSREGEGCLLMLSHQAIIICFFHAVAPSLSQPRFQTDAGWRFSGGPEH